MLSTIDSIVLISIILGVLFFVVLINYFFFRRDVKKMNFGNIATQLIALIIWLAILGNLILPIDFDDNTYELITFLAAIIMGIFLLVNLSREMRTQDVIDKLVERLKKDNKRLQELNRQKTEFISFASHQLRGPLTVIQGYTSMLLEGEYGRIGKKVKEPIQRIYRSGTTLGFLINDYLDLSRIERGKIKYVFKNIDLLILLNNLYKEFQIIADKTDVKFKFKPNKKDELMVYSDENKLQQVISNILDNAFKYTKKGTIEISYEKKEASVVISIKDTGVGVKHEDLSNIFAKFERGKDSLYMHSTGSGLGLYVAKNMVEAQGGRIWAESGGLGKGSTFKISLPLAKR